MAISILSWLVAIPLLGFCTGLRTMLPLAIACWFVYKHNLPVPPGWAFWMSYPVTRIVFTVLAAGELIGDKLPQTPNRTAPFPFAARIAFGGLIGALAATGLKGSIPEGVILGALGAALGAFLGFHTRRLIVERTGWPDWPVALAEDVLAIISSVYAMGIVTG
jgi:uncharacterized membrane protein